MKRFYLALSAICIVLITIMFFQTLTGIYVQVPMFTKRVGIHIYLVTVITLAFFSGVFMTSGITKFSSGSDLDDDFDL